MRHVAVGLLVLSLAGCSKACEDPPGRLVLFDGYGTPNEVHVAGRVLIDQRSIATSSSASAWINLNDSWGTLETDEIANAKVEITIDDQKFEAITDADGRFELTAKAGEKPFPIGALKIEGDADDAGRPIPKTNALAFVHDERGGVFLISDFDDTVADSGVKDNGRVIASTLFKNALQVPLIRGADKAYAAAIQAGIAGVFYLSGSPHSLHDRLSLFLTHHRLPRGPILLKNFGADPILAQEGYKLGHLRRLAERYPNHRFLLVGDSGEHDPEIYAALRKEKPQQVLAIVIRRAPGGAHHDARFEKMIVVDEYAPDLLVNLVKTATRAE